MLSVKCLDDLRDNPRLLLRLRQDRSYRSAVPVQGLAKIFWRQGCREQLLDQRWVLSRLEVRSQLAELRGPALMTILGPLYSHLPSLDKPAIEVRERILSLLGVPEFHKSIAGPILRLLFAKFIVLPWLSVRPEGDGTCLVPLLDELLDERGRDTGWLGCEEHFVQSLDICQLRGDVPEPQRRPCRALLHNALRRRVRRLGSSRLGPLVAPLGQTLLHIGAQSCSKLLAGGFGTPVTVQQLSGRSEVLVHQIAICAVRGQLHRLPRVPPELACRLLLKRFPNKFTGHLPPPEIPRRRRLHSWC
mmetsp:Transcript_55883/g.181440  ORF Transcript_55883/g.181440 Transcript_55883/m.181440 type:complete len:303 (-) Transcript_55883:89-997(-)